MPKIICNAFWVFILPDRNFPNFLMVVLQDISGSHVFRILWIYDSDKDDNTVQVLKAMWLCDD